MWAASTFVMPAVQAVASAGPLAVNAWNAANFAIIQAGVEAVASAVFSPKVSAEGSPTKFQINTDAGIPFAFGSIASKAIVEVRTNDRLQRLASGDGWAHSLGRGLLRQFGPDRSNREQGRDRRPLGDCLHDFGVRRAYAPP
tara:strand:+ start:86 stop:511 length:426 start_codon:yes stop_codon:yes gene_type:complete